MFNNRITEFGSLHDNIPVDVPPVANTAGATHAAAEGGSALAIGLATNAALEKMGSKNPYVNTTLSGAAGGGGAKAGMALARNALTVGEEIGAKDIAMTFARGAAEGGPMALATLPIDMALNKKFREDGLNPVQAGAASGAASTVIISAAFYGLSTAAASVAAGEMVGGPLMAPFALATLGFAGAAAGMGALFGAFEEEEYHPLYDYLDEEGHIVYVSSEGDKHFSQYGLDYWKSDDAYHLGEKSVKADNAREAMVLLQGSLPTDVPGVEYIGNGTYRRVATSGGVGGLTEKADNATEAEARLNTAEDAIFDDHNRAADEALAEQAIFDAHNRAADEELAEARAIEQMQNLRPYEVPDIQYMGDNTYQRQTHDGVETVQAEDVVDAEAQLNNWG